jgi:SET domain-containing protein
MSNLQYKGRVEVRPCLHGRGLFAKKDLAKGALIFSMKDLVLTPTPTSPPERSFALRVGENQYWDDAPAESPYYWSNFIDHSKHPNSRFYFDKKKKTVTYRTTKPVKRGHEIFLKYDDYFHSNPTFGEK